MTNPRFTLSRRAVLASATLPLFSIVTRRADAAEFELKYATGQDPTHPVNVRAKQALDRSSTLMSDLKAKGINFITVPQDDFRKKLASTSFYSDWKAKYGATAWDLLEKVSGKLG